MKNEIWEHEFTVVFVVRSERSCATEADEDYPTADEVLAGLKARVRYLENHKDDVRQAVGVPQHSEPVGAQEAREWWDNISEAWRNALVDWFNPYPDLGTWDINLIYSHRHQLPPVTCDKCGETFIQSNCLDDNDLFQGVRAKKHAVYTVVTPHTVGSIAETKELCSACFEALQRCAS